LTAYKLTLDIYYISSCLEIPFSIYLVAIYKIVRTHLTFSETSAMDRGMYVTFLGCRSRREHLCKEVFVYMLFSIIFNCINCWCHYNMDWFDFWCFNVTFSNIMAISFSGGRRQSTRKESPTMGKQLVNFITCSCESSAHFLVI